MLEYVADATLHFLKDRLLSSDGETSNALIVQSTLKVRMYGPLEIVRFGTNDGITGSSKRLELLLARGSRGVTEIDDLLPAEIDFQKC